MELELEPITLPGVEDKRPMVIAGPCSAETEEQVMSTAKQLADKGLKLFRAGIWKPRTKPGGFEGVGVDAAIQSVNNNVDFTSSKGQKMVQIAKNQQRDCANRIVSHPYFLQSAQLFSSKAETEYNKK